VKGKEKRKREGRLAFRPCGKKKKKRKKGVLEDQIQGAAQKRERAGRHALTKRGGREEFDQTMEKKRGKESRPPCPVSHEKEKEKGKEKTRTSGVDLQKKGWRTSTCEGRKKKKKRGHHDN